MSMRVTGLGSPATHVVPEPPGDGVLGPALMLPAPARPANGGTIRVAGKTFRQNGHSFAVRGVTYGSFLPRHDGFPFPKEAVVREDFAAMRDCGLNTVRTYATPPLDVVDAAEEAGLRLLIGVDYADWRMTPHDFRGRQVLDAGRRALDEAVAVCQGRLGAVLGVVVGNEVPGDLVRLLGTERVQDVLSTLVGHVHDADPELLATYANYPTTEYLDVEGADFLAFNVFLERPDALRRYTAHLHVLAGDRPVVVSELGMAEQVHGADQQADMLAQQLAEVDAAGAAGACVFSWTDEWGVAGQSVGGWGFGVTTEERRPKPALDAVADWAGRDLRALRAEWPTVSVVVCAYNEERYIGDCLASLLRVDYPGLEVVVCDDGSTDRTGEIVSRYPFRVLSLEHGGLSAARNAGLAAAGGDIVAYLDADAMCDPDWPYHLALSLEDGADATGGPNLPVPGAGFQERVVAASPGGPVEVLLADDRAEHVAGCNMAVRRHVLTDLGGFDVAYTSAGDDVDVCWRLIDAGHQIGFAHAAQVWHHRRDTVARYLRQQRNYGRSERMVAGRHAERFNRLGQARWAGVLYCAPRMRWPLLRPLLYQGHFGSAPYQRVVDRPADTAMQIGGAMLPLTAPVGLAGGAAAVWWPWALSVPALMLVLVVSYGVLAAVAIRPGRGEPAPARLRCLAGVLHAVQPFVRTWGRLRGRPLSQGVSPRQQWTGDRWAWLATLQRELARGWRRVTPGDPTDGWDLAVTVGPCARYQITTAVVWNWQPVWRGRLRPRRRYVAALATASLLPFAAAWLTLVPVGLLAAAAVEATVLRRTVDPVLRRTSVQAAPEAAGGT